MKFKVLTFNTWGLKPLNGERWPIIGKGISELSPDLVGLQEVFSRDQAYQLQKMTGIPEISFMDDHSGLAILSSFPLSEAKVHRYLTSSPIEPYFRFCQSSAIELAKDLPILFVVTHLSWKPEDAAVRESQVMELLHFIPPPVSRPGGPTTKLYPPSVDETGGGIIETGSIGQTCILVGDFNATPDSKEMGLILNAGFVDTFGSLHPDDPGFTWSQSNPYTATHPELPQRRIDHIFVRTPRGSTLAVESSEIVLDKPTADGIFPSDHFGLVTTFLGNRGQPPISKKGEQ